MNFPLLICSNCEKEKDEDDFFLFGLKNEKGLNKTNFVDSNILSNTDNNNNSTNNYLEIIEYPYSSNNNKVDDTNNNILQKEYQPIKTEVVKTKKRIIDYDDDLIDIKPPKLFSEPKKQKNDEIHYIKTEPEKKIETTLDFDNKKKNDSNSHINVNSNINESLIKNDNSIMNNKILLTNYYLNLQNNKKLQDNLENIKQDQKKNESNNISSINNLVNNYNNNKIIGVKVDYPCPDTNSFYLNNNEKTSLKTKSIEEESNKKSCNIGENGIQKNLFLKKMKKIVREENNKKNYSKFNFSKPKIKAKSNNNVNIDIIKVNLKKKKKNTNKKDEEEFKNRMIKRKKKLTFNSLSNFSNRFNLNLKNSNDNICTFFIQIENINEINERNQNIFKIFLEKRKKQNKLSNISRIVNRTTIFSSKTCTNPFTEIYNHKQKKSNL